MRIVLVGFVLVACVWAQSGADRSSSADRPVPAQEPERGAAREIGSGAGTVGIGVGKGAVAVAKGTGKGAVDLVTLHPIDAGVSVGQGVAAAGKDVAAGTVKGTVKIGKGVGKAIRKIF